MKAPVMFVCFLFIPAFSSFSGVFSTLKMFSVSGMFSFSLCGSSDLRLLGGVLVSAVFWTRPASWQRYSSGTPAPGTLSHRKWLPSRGLSERKSKPQRRDASSRSFRRAAWYSSWSCSRSTGPNRFRLAGLLGAAGIRFGAAMVLHCLNTEHPWLDLRCHMMMRWIM